MGGLNGVRRRGNTIVLVQPPAQTLDLSRFSPQGCSIHCSAVGKCANQWLPEETPESLFEAQPWLREHFHQSVPALEILHGVLRYPNMDKSAFFNFRDPANAAAHAGFTEEDPAFRKELAKLKTTSAGAASPLRSPSPLPGSYPNHLHSCQILWYYSILDTSTTTKAILTKLGNSLLNPFDGG